VCRGVEMRATGRASVLGSLCLLMSVAGIGVAHAATGDPAGATPTTVTTSLSDGTNSGTSLTELAGTAVTDTATLTGTNASAATGTITYNVYSDANCTDLVNSGSQTITTPGTVPASAPVTLNPPGTYYWQAVYSGDSENEGSSSTCGPGGEVETVLSPTSVTTMLTGGGQSGATISVPAGTSVTDSANLGGAFAASATGTVTYDVYSDDACTDLVYQGTDEQITPPGTLPPSAGVTLSTAGTYYWQASYSGDANNAPSQTICGDEVETVTPAPTTVAASLSGNGQTGTTISVPAGTAVTDAATLSGIDSAAATGSVTYTVYSDPKCTDEVATGGTQPVTAGIPAASAPVTLTNVGTYYWQAAYSGDGGNAPSVSACGANGDVTTVTSASTTATGSLSGDGQTGSTIIVQAGTAATDTETLSGTDADRATGTVTYTVYSNAACTTVVSTGSAESITPQGMVPSSPAVTLTIAGTYYWQATYSGDQNNEASTTPCGPSGEVEMVTPAQQPTSLTASLSGGGHTGPTISVPGGTPVTDTTTLSGADMSVATGTITYIVYSNKLCTTAVSTYTVTVTTAGTMPASAPVTLDIPGTYYWQASYSGDLNNAPFTTVCGLSGEVETVTPAPIATTVTTSLLSAPKSGASITVLAGTSVRDSAKLSGVNAAKATGKVTYKVYSNAACTALVASAGTVTVTGGAVPDSSAETLTTPGTYYWTASYGGDSSNKAAASDCGAEKEVVTPAPVIDTHVSALGSHTVTVKVSTATAGDLLVAFVSGRGPAGKSQTATVSGGLKWTLAGRAYTGRGDAEVWYAKPVGKLDKLAVKATERYIGSNVTLTVVAFKNAVGIGRRAAFHSASGAPRGKLITSKANSWVFAVGDDWLNSAARTPGAGQGLVYQATDSAHDTYWVQETKAATPKAGTTVTINDTKPAKDPYNLVLVEIVAR
jgi:hypothetical protein